MFEYEKISRRSFLAAAGLTVAALALTACGGSASTASSAAASSVAASSEAASTSAAAAELTTVEAGKLTMATNATFPPYEMTTDAGTIEGIDVDTAQAIAKKLGLELQIDDMDFDAALLSVQQGKADIAMAGITVTDERMAVMSFSDSYATGIQSVIVPEGSDIASVDDLAGKKIGTQRGTTGYLYCSDDFGDDCSRGLRQRPDRCTGPEQRPGGRCGHRQRARQGLCGVQPRPEDPGHQLRRGGLRHWHEQEQHRSAGGCERRSGGAEGDGTLQAIVDKYIKAE